MQRIVCIAALRHVIASVLITCPWRSHYRKRFERFITRGHYYVGSSAEQISDLSVTVAEFTSKIDLTLVDVFKKAIRHGMRD